MCITATYHIIVEVLSVSITECSNYTMAETSLNLATEVVSNIVLPSVTFSVVFLVLGEDEQVIWGEG